MVSVDVLPDFVLGVRSAPLCGPATADEAVQRDGQAKRLGRSGRKIVLATIGSLGDLYPFLAVAQSLQKVGWDPVLCVPESHLATTREAGLSATAIMPPFEDVWRGLGLTQTEAVDRIITDRDFMIRAIAIPAVAQGVAAIDSACSGAAAIVSNLFALAAPIVAERRGIPLIPTYLQPMSVFSAYDPPIGQGFGTISTRRGNFAARWWNRACLAIVRREMRRRYSPALDECRCECGLPRQSTTPILGAEAEAILRVGLFPDFFAPNQPDFPKDFVAVGFPLFDGCRYGEELDTEIEEFLSSGPPPLVFTLGSLVSAAPRLFYSESVSLARALGLRAILLTGGMAISASSDMIIRDYLPHSLVFPRAAAIVHHGGIGTTGQALVAGRPQLVVPHMGDQFDNAARLARLGVAKTLKASRFSVGRGVRAVASLLEDEPTQVRAAALATLLRSQNGADRAARAIVTALSDYAAKRC